MPLPNNYTCNGQMNFEEILKLMQGPQMVEKTKGEEIQAYETYGIRNKQIRGQRTWLHYNPNPSYRLNDGPYVIFATVAYTSETTVYAKEFMCYPVLHEFATGKEAVNYYKKFVREIEKIIEMNPKIVYQETSIQLGLEEMYKIDGEWRAESWKREHKYLR